MAVYKVSVYSYFLPYEAIKTKHTAGIDSAPTLVRLTSVSILFQRYQAPAKNVIFSGSAFKIKLRCSSVTSGLKFAPNTKMVNKANLDISQSATAVENSVNFEALTP